MHKCCDLFIVGIPSLAIYFHFQIMAFDQCVSSAIEKYDSAITLKDKQRDILCRIFDGRDCVAVLPTGYGKSLLFHLTPLMMSVKRVEHAYVIVVCPINAIMEDQMKSLTNKNIPSCVLSLDGKHFKEYSDSSDGNSVKVSPISQLNPQTVSIIFTHPETILQDDYIRQKLSTEHQQHACCIVIDEVHRALDCLR